MLALFSGVGAENFQPLRFSMVKFAIGVVGRIVFYLFGGTGVVHYALEKYKLFSQTYLPPKI
jgi:hypothetical protein